MRSSLRLGSLAAIAIVGALAFCSSASAAGGTVSGWGYNVYGGIGAGNKTQELHTPTAAVGLSEVTGIDAGYYTSVAQRADGTVSGTGGNFYGEATGGAGPNEVLSHTQVPGVANVIQVATGEYHSLALLSNGTVMAWGANFFGQLGAGSSSGPETCKGAEACRRQPLPVPGLANVIAISAFQSTSLALLADGTVMAWGYDNFGETGSGTGTQKGCFCVDHPVAVPGVTGAVAIAMGKRFGMALLEDGTIRSWGYDFNGQLGNGTALTEGCFCSAAGPVSGIATAKTIGAGDNNGFAVLGDGTARAWGWNIVGQLGLGSDEGPEECSSEACSKVPVQIPGLTGIAAIDGGNYFGLALLADGTARGWGANNFYELGDGTDDPHFSPVTVVGLTAATAISAGEYTGLAIVGPPQTLNVVFAGAGSGRVGTDGLVCPASNCSEKFSQGATKTLRVTSTAGGFAGFSGPCRGTGATCQVKMDTDQTVTATFGIPKGTAIVKSDVDNKMKTASITFSAPGAITGYECKLIKPATKPKKKKRKGKGKKHRAVLVKKGSKKPKPAPPPAFAPCTGPAVYANLRPGKYTFEVRALDILGADATPAVQKFQIKKPKPKKKKKQPKR